MKSIECLRDVGSSELLSVEGGGIYPSGTCPNTTEGDVVLNAVIGSFGMVGILVRAYNELNQYYCM